jgi:uncharacterized membrane protein
MSFLLEFVRKTLIGGVVFLLPLGIFVVVLGELMDALSGLGDEIGNSFFPNSEGRLLPILITIGVIITMAFIAGLVATTAMGEKANSKFELFAQSAIPGYAVVRQAVTEVSGGAPRVDSEMAVRIVKVDLGTMSCFGYLIDQLSNGEQVVFLPGAPSVFKGHVIVVKPDQIAETSLDSTTLMKAMQQLGHGLEISASN